MFSTIVLIISSMCLMASLIGNVIWKPYYKKDWKELRAASGVLIMIFTAIIMYLIL